jgi:outer membrane protein assembly factor BamB
MALNKDAMQRTLRLIEVLSCLMLSLTAASGLDMLTNDWTLDVRSVSDSAPAIGADGTIYFGTWKGNLWAVSPDGSRKWVFPAGNEIKSAPAVGTNGMIYFGSRDGNCYAVDADGALRWKFHTGAWVDSSPALAHDGTVYFGSWDKNFYALSADGKQLWKFPTSGEIVSSPAIGLDGTIYFGSHDRKFYALAPNGNKKWEFTTGGPIISSPAMNRDQCLYFTSVDGCLYALNLDGTLRWRLRTGGMTESSPVIGADGTVYVGVLRRPWAISADGKKKWGREGGEDYALETTPVVLASGSICFVSRYGMLIYVKPDGTMELKCYLYGYGYGSPAVGPTGAIYVPDRGKDLGCGFTALRAGVSLAHTPWPRFRGNAQNTGNAQDIAP